MQYNPMFSKPCFFKKGVPCGQNFYEYAVKDKCFIVCPSSDEVSSERELIKKVLEEMNIEPVIAAEDKRPNEEIMCAKICKGIIGSAFCIVLLTDTRIDKKDINSAIGPNGNVYFEYGLTMALNKKVLSIIKQGQMPLFDIQGLDLLIYDERSGIPIEELRDHVSRMVKEKPIDNDILRRYQKNTEKELLSHLANLHYWSGRIRCHQINDECVWRELYMMLGSFNQTYYEILKSEGMLKYLEPEIEEQVIKSYNILQNFSRRITINFDKVKTCKTEDEIRDYSRFISHDTARYFEDVYKLLCLTLILMNKENEEKLKHGFGIDINALKS